MKRCSWRNFYLACLFACLGAPQPCLAGLTMTSGIGATHAGNLVTNGSFETGAPPSGSTYYWATGSALTPFAAPPGWTTSGDSPAYASWGNDNGAPLRLQGSDVIPDGSNALYFGNGGPVLPSQGPTFHANGSVTFPSTPTMTTFFATQPVILAQTINTPANPSPYYKFSFWVSGEDAGINQVFAERGIFGLQVTNTLAGDPINYLSVPNGVNNTFGMSHLYEFVFTPLNTSLPVTIRFINWGHFDLSAYGMANFTTELVLDDVIVNAVPEPSSGLLLLLGTVSLGLAARRRSRR
ncbi:MAG: PEP-CTERM sorting domain-containing protein [Pirellulales bacterium]|nr:PEP-CTERM sorting domain-containing protein [Pirellulales bacterium]